MTSRNCVQTRLAKSKVRRSRKSSMFSRSSVVWMTCETAVDVSSVSTIEGAMAERWSVVVAMAAWVSSRWSCTKVEAVEGVALALSRKLSVSHDHCIDQLRNKLFCDCLLKIERRVETTSGSA